jgi:alanine-glyoxylate transaminase / serine-glyoxylate transaminase / serine-pyruvate transaminase
MTEYTDLNTTPRILLGPGPSTVHPRVLRAMAHPLVGHLDPQFITLMNEVQDLLRFVFETKNAITLPVSGTGSAGMEAAVCNFIEVGDPVLICVSGYFGQRLVEMAKRYGADVTVIEHTWGEVFSPDEIKTALEKKAAKVVMIVHAETSTGALQPLDGIADIVHHHGALLLLDCVTSLGGMPVEIDANGIDVAYSGTQKCLSCPPGLSPFTASPRAMQVLRERNTKVTSWYLDISMLESYWGDERTYHHTAPITMNYGLREALRLVYEEGLEARFKRHRENAEFFWAGLAELGLEPIVPLAYRLPSLTTIQVPDGVDAAAVSRQLLSRYNIEIAGGLGIFKGKAWRVGLMGYSSSQENCLLLLAALREILAGR